MLSRRRLLSAGLGALCWPRSTWAASPKPVFSSEHYEIRDIVLPKRAPWNRFTLLIPTISQKRPVPLLVLLHGLGETHDPRMGAHAWLERYGLARAYHRLHQAPVKALNKMGRHWSKKALDEVNAQLAAQAFAGYAIACPHTPNVYRARSRTAMLDRYADWIGDVVVPRARSEANIISDAAHTSLDGCSLGGYVGLEVFLRKAAMFHSWGSVQGALGAHRLSRYVERLTATLAKHGPRRIHLETSSGDAFRKVNETFSRALRAASIPHDFSLLPGPHNQPFLRDSGTLTMLQWHDRNFAAKPTAPHSSAVEANKG